MRIKITLLVFGVIGLLTSCQQTASEATSPVKTGMIKVAIMYPSGEGHTFDMDYYSNKHMPMVADLFGEPLKGLEIEEGISGRTPNDPIPYLAIGYFFFDKLEDYNNAFGPNAEKILGDIPNYTNIQPIVQISKVVQ